MPDTEPSATMTPGSGGRARQMHYDKIVDKMAGAGSPPATAPASPVGAPKQSAKPSSFAPGPAVSSHVYGAPISAPILSGGK